MDCENALYNLEDSKTLIVTLWSKMVKFKLPFVSGFHFSENWLSVNWNRESNSKPIPITEIIISFHF